jgi:hypothetical protein
MNPTLVGRPTNAADRFRKLTLTSTSRLAIRRTASWTVDRDDRWLTRIDQLNDLLMVQVVLKIQKSVIVDERDIETLPFPAHIDTEPSSHGQSMPDSRNCCPQASPSTGSRCRRTH